MNPLFEHHLSGTDQGLRRDLDCISAGEAEINAAVGKRLCDIARLRVCYS